GGPNMPANPATSRQLKYGGICALYVIVIIAGGGAGDFLAKRYSESYDSTPDKKVSLSDQSIKDVQGVKNDVKVTYFGDTETFLRARDLLDRYSSLSPKLKVEMLDPEKKPQQAKAAGFRRGGQMLISSNGRQEEAKSLTEEEVTGALIRSQ